MGVSNPSCAWLYPHFAAFLNEILPLFILDWASGTCCAMPFRGVVAESTIEEPLHRPCPPGARTHRAPLLFSHAARSVFMRPTFLAYKWNWQFDSNGTYTNTTNGQLVLLGLGIVAAPSRHVVQLLYRWCCCMSSHACCEASESIESGRWCLHVSRAIELSSEMMMMVVVSGRVESNRHEQWSAMSCWLYWYRRTVGLDHPLCCIVVIKVCNKPMYSVENWINQLEYGAAALEVYVACISSSIGY